MSKNCPWMSPTTVTGACMCTTLLSFISSSFVFAHTASITESARSSLRYSRSMHSSRSTLATHGVSQRPDIACDRRATYLVGQALLKIGVEGELIPQRKTAFRLQDGASGTTQIAQPGLIILSNDGYSEDRNDDTKMRVLLMLCRSADNVGWSGDGER